MSAEPDEARTSSASAISAIGRPRTASTVMPGVRGLHRGPHARPRRPGGGAERRAERLGRWSTHSTSAGPEGCRRTSRRSTRRSFATRRSATRRRTCPAPPTRPPHPRGAHGPAASGRGRPAAGRAGGGAAPGVPLAVEAPSRATAELPGGARETRLPSAHHPRGSLTRSRPAPRGAPRTTGGVRISAVNRRPSSGPAARGCEMPCARHPAAAPRCPRGDGTRAARSGARCRAGSGRHQWPSG